MSTYNTSLSVQDDAQEVGLDAIARKLNEICRGATLDLAFRIGRLVIQEIFAGDSQLWHTDGPRQQSYRTLASRPNLALSASALCRAVAVYVLVEQLGGRERWSHLAASHFQEVLPLAAGARNALLARAEEERWTVSQLRAEVNRHRSPRRVHAQRHVARSLHRLSASLTKQRETLDNLGNSSLPADSLNDIHAALRSMRSEIERLEALTRVAGESRSRSDVRELLVCAEREFGRRDER